ncbi:hypothetical protein [Moraxella sp. ZY210820]|uniref:hypothetical protein n=1 Tax=unclassified Moraxella TaxID=2685852 RepID=UPI0027309113|nr:hypothetical protein [Moraxella sp. ZY210820]WLF84078.1 hypothetical protein LU301_00765 [Moraxella sp. ZY210820]
MKKILLFLAIFVAGCVSYPTIKAKAIEYKVRDYLKTVDVNEFIPAQYKIAGIKINTQGQNQYPQFVATGSINYGLNIQLPQMLVTEAQQRIAEKACNGLEKLREKDIDIRKAIVEVAKKDQVSLVVVLQDKNQHELLRHEQKLTDCANLDSLAQ